MFYMAFRVFSFFSIINSLAEVLRNRLFTPSQSTSPQICCDACAMGMTRRACSFGSCPLHTHRSKVNQQAQAKQTHQTSQTNQAQASKKPPNTNSRTKNRAQSMVWVNPTLAQKVQHKWEQTSKSVSTTIQLGASDGKDRRRRNENGEGQRSQVC